MSFRRLKFIRSLFLVTLIIVTFRLYAIQSKSGEEYSSAAALQQSRNKLVYKERGDIIDRKGIRFTGRKCEWKAILQPYTLINDPIELRTLAEIFGFSVAELKNKLSKDMLPYIMDITPAQAKAILDSSLKGISVIDVKVRYDESAVATHVLGYINDKSEGMAGLEKQYQNTLGCGQGIYAGILADAGNGFMSNLGYRIWDYTGRDKLNVQLTIDYHLQEIVENVMDRMVDKGAVVLLDIVNGKILAIASRPDYDPTNIKPYLNDDTQPLFNRAIGAYTPGSIFKMITAAAALENQISANLTYDCLGYAEVGGIKMKCSSYEDGGHGEINMAQAFARSCNSYFIHLGQEVGIDKILDTAELFGLGQLTGLSKQGIAESEGCLPGYLRKMSPAEIGNVSIGQGELLLTPVQAANMAATIANGGILNEVTLIEAIVNDNGHRIRNVNNPVWKRVISKETAAALQGMMLLTVESGTGRWADIGGHGGSAGKTGSAETGWIKDNRDILHAWFCGYFPIDCPRYSLCVFIEDGQSGSSSAAPIFAEISAQIMDAGY